MEDIIHHPPIPFHPLRSHPVNLAALFPFDTLESQAPRLPRLPFQLDSPNRPSSMWIPTLPSPSSSPSLISASSAGQVQTSETPSWQPAAGTVPLFGAVAPRNRANRIASAVHCDESRVVDALEVSVLGAEANADSESKTFGLEEYVHVRTKSHDGEQDFEARSVADAGAVEPHEIGHDRPGLRTVLDIHFDDGRVVEHGPKILTAVAIETYEHAQEGLPSTEDEADVKEIQRHKQALSVHTTVPEHDPALSASDGYIDGYNQQQQPSSESTLHRLLCCKHSISVSSLNTQARPLQLSNTLPLLTIPIPHHPSTPILRHVPFPKPSRSSLLLHTNTPGSPQKYRQTRRTKLSWYRRFKLFLLGRSRSGSGSGRLKQKNRNRRETIEHTIAAEWARWREEEQANIELCSPERSSLGGRGCGWLSEQEQVSPITSRYPLPEIGKRTSMRRNISKRLRRGTGEVQGQWEVQRHVTQSHATEGKYLPLISRPIEEPLGPARSYTGVRRGGTVRGSVRSKSTGRGSLSMTRAPLPCYVARIGGAAGGAGKAVTRKPTPTSTPMGLASLAIGGDRKEGLGGEILISVNF